MWRWFTYDDDDEDNDDVEEETDSGTSQQEQETASPRRRGDTDVVATLDDLDPAVTAAILAQVLLTAIEKTAPAWVHSSRVCVFSFNCGSHHEIMRS